MMKLTKLTETKTEAEIKIEAKKIKEKGSPLTIDQIEAFIMKEEAGRAKKAKKAKKAFAKRDEVKAMNIQADENASDWLAAKNKENAKNNLPSSMR